jgi:hypothetical protein
MTVAELVTLNGRPFFCCRLEYDNGTVVQLPIPDNFRNGSSVTWMVAHTGRAKWIGTVEGHDFLCKEDLWLNEGDEVIWTPTFS